MRVFIALPIPADAAAQIAVLQDRLRHCGIRMRWIVPDRLHFTLAFLGEITAMQVERLACELNRALVPFPSFQYLLTGLGAFPHLDRARILWVGVDQGAQLMTELACLVVETVRHCQLPFDVRPFKPHLTIGRARRPGPLRLPTGRRTDISLELQARQVTVMQSELAPDGPVYTPLHTIPLVQTEARNPELEEQ